MTIQLLISVTNVPEALIAIDADVDIIDLKDPSMGALGALPQHVIIDVVQAVNKRAIVSATVGEQHPTIEHLISRMKQTAALGVDIVKVAVSTALLKKLAQHAEFFDAMQGFNDQKCKLVAVMFADELLEASANAKKIEQISQLGFYGVMLDTASKEGQCLFDYQSLAQLQAFVDLCRQHELASGLAGSLRLVHAKNLLALNASYIGFRGGVCKENNRKLALDDLKVSELTNVVKKYKNSIQAC